MSRNFALLAGMAYLATFLTGSSALTWASDLTLPKWDLDQSAKSLRLEFEWPPTVAMSSKDLVVHENDKRLEWVGPWHAPSEALSGGFSTLTLSVPVELPSQYNVLGPDMERLKVEKSSGNKTTYLFQIPIQSTGDGAASHAKFQILPASGKPIPLTLKVSLPISSDQFTGSRNCSRGDFKIRKVNGRGDIPALFVLNCDVQKLQVAIQPLSDARWGAVPANTTLVKDEKVLIARGDDSKTDPNAWELPIAPFSLESHGSTMQYELYQDRNPNLRWFDHVRIGGLGILQAVSLGYSITGQLSWNPEFVMPGTASRWLGLQGNFAVSLPRSATFLTYFPALDYQIFAQFLRFRPFIIAVGGGAQTWIGQGGTGGVAALDLSWKFNRKVLYVLDRVFLGYTGFFYTGEFTHEFKAGLGFSF